MELFLFDKKNHVFIHPEAVRLTDHIKKLDKLQAAYIILAYSYRSKYHMFPLEDRKRRAKRDIYPGMGDTDVEDGNPLLKNAISEYNDLQYDSARETVRTYIDKIDQLQKRLTLEPDESKIIKIDKTITILQKSLEAANDKLFKSEQEEIKLKGNKKKSFIEDWQSRMVAHRKAQRQHEQDEMDAEQAGIELV